MFFKLQYLIWGFSFVTSSISVIVSTNRPESIETQLKKKVDGLFGLYEGSGDVKMFISKIEQQKKELGEIVGKIQMDDGGFGMSSSSVWGAEGGSKKPFELIVTEMGWKNMEDKEELEKKIKSLKVGKDNMHETCRRWNNNSYRNDFLDYLIWCTDKSPILK